MTWVAFEAAPIEAELRLARDPQRAIRALRLVQNRLDVNQQSDSADPTAKPLRQAAQVRLTRSKLILLYPIRHRFELLTHILAHDTGEFWRRLNDRQIHGEFENGATVWRHG